MHLGRANTAGDVVAWIADAKVLVAGDLVVHPFPYATQSFVSEWAAAMRKLEAMPYDALVPGHGPVMRDRQYVSSVRERFAGGNAIIAANFDYMIGDLAVGRAWEELERKFEPERLKLD